MRRIRPTPLNSSLPSSALPRSGRSKEAGQAGRGSATLSRKAREREEVWPMKRVTAVLSLFLLFTLACSKAPEQRVEEKAKVSVGPVVINPHPKTLEDKIVVLRW